jgi:disulfide oxidoreductase YuzD
MGIQPDRHVVGGDVIGWNVITVAACQSPEQAREVSEWIKTALKEKAAAMPKNGLILPARLKDIT